MGPTNKRVLKRCLQASDVCAIIKTCKESNVSKLQFGDLQVDFTFHVEQFEAHPITGEAPLEQLIEKQEKDTLEKEAMQSKSERLALMAIEDPAEYERLIMAGELEDELESGREETYDS